MTSGTRRPDLGAVIFDFDGIIADTERLHYQAFERVLAPRGRGITWEQYVESCIGFDDRDVFRLRLADSEGALSDAALQALVDEKARCFVDLVQEDGAVIYPGVWSLIRRLREKDVPMSVCSGALQSDIEAVVKAAGFEHSFEAMVTAEDVACSKPDPAGYRMALQRMAARHPGRDIRPGTVVAIEDTPTGIAAAQGAGLAVLAVTNTHAERALGAANAVVSSLEAVSVEALARILGGMEAAPGKD